MQSASTAAISAEEVMRCHSFLAISASLALVGAAAAYLFDGDPEIRLGFTLGVLALLVGYLGLYRHTRDPANYTPRGAVVVITICNLAGILGCLYYGFFSPAPMIMMLPIAFIGLSDSGSAAWIAYVVAAGSMAVPMALLVSGTLSDPGIVQASGLGVLGRLLYAGLVQAVYLCGMVYARAGRRSMSHAVEGLEAAMRAVRQREARLEEVQDQLELVLDEGRRGPLSGTSLGTWTLGELLGRGAMGDVYGAGRGDEEAAVKVLNPITMSDPEAIALMRREAELLASVDSPHIVRILELQVGDLPWIAMERLRGEDLAEILRRRDRLGGDEVVRLVAEVGQGLHTAAEASILHRDVKPTNLFLAARDDGPSRWKILDFGVAKRLGHDSTMTRGRMLGTPGYMSPEHIQDDEADARSDTWSLAAVAYRALTGARPFRGRREELLLSALYDQPEAPSHWTDLHEDVDAVFAIALAKQREARFTSALEFAEALTASLEGGLLPSFKERAARILAREPWGSTRR